VKRFGELQDKFFVICARLQLAQTPEEKLTLLNELERITQESAQALAEIQLSTVSRDDALGFEKRGACAPDQSGLPNEVSSGSDARTC
jgi:transposase-like protein